MSAIPAISLIVTEDAHQPFMDEEQVEMLAVVDEGDGEQSLLVELYEMFVEESGGKLSKLELLCESGDLAGLRKLVHFVAGSAANIGFLRLSHYYRNIEKAIDTGILKDIAGAAVPIRASFQSSCEYFEKTYLS
jgi:HPt (histidine-containing phosphotransfer) domain-containing protein